jgi:hypothetical protein
VSYESWLPLQLPAWYQDPNGTALWSAVGALLDQLAEQARQGARAGFPTKGAVDRTSTPPTEVPPADDALAATGFDRVLPRGTSETSSAYAARLLAAWDEWTNGGNLWGVLHNLELAGYGRPTAIQQNGRSFVLTGSTGTIADLSFGTLMAQATRGGHPGWDFDGRDNFWSEGALIFTSDATNLQTAAGQQELNATVLRWKPSNLLFKGSFVILSGGNLWGWPTSLTWGQVSLDWGGNSIRFIPGDGSPAFTVGP